MPIPARECAQWQDSGCENCDPGMPMDVEQVQEQTTANFAGVIAIMDPERSWCARWKRKSAPPIYHASALRCQRGLIMRLMRGAAHGRRYDPGRAQSRSAACFAEKYIPGCYALRVDENAAD